MKPKKIKPKKIKSINFTLWLNFTVFSIATVFIMAVVIMAIYYNVYSSRARDKVFNLGSEITTSLSMGNYTNEKALNRYLQTLEYDDGVKIFLIRDDLSVIYPSANTYDEQYLADMLALAKNKLSDSEGGLGAVYRTDNANLRFSVRLDYGGEESAILIVNYFMGLAQKISQTLALYILLVSLIVILLAFIVSYFISIKLSVPLNSVTVTASELAKGNYDVKFAETEYEEVAQLSDTLNYVAKEIKKSDAMKKQLIANVSHDLKTPLTMIKAYASMIREISGDNPEKREKHLQVIIDETDRLTWLVNDVLSVSKVTADSDLNKKVFNLSDYLYGIIDKFAYLQETQGYSIMVDIDPNLYTLADSEKIGQVLYNLISHAVNYTGEDKKIYISLKNDLVSGRIKFFVRDTGKGITGEDLENIWNRYYRIKETHTRPVKGTGLGLNIVKIVLENHRFDFGVKSEIEKGSTFWVDFPSVPEEPIENSK